jgi:hypothetical protein
MSDKKERRRFDKALLDQCIKRDGVTLIGEYEYLNAQTKIKFKCKCNGEDTRGFDKIVNGLGLVCKKCTLHKIKQSKNLDSRYNNYNLVEIFMKDGAEILKKDTILNKNSIITAKCKCGNLFEKTFHCIYDRGGPFCESCIKKNKPVNMLNTFNTKYGCHPAKLQETKIKQENSNLEKHGVKFVSQNKDIRKKQIDTNTKKYGVEHPCQNLEIQEKAQKNAKKYKEYKMPSGTIRKVQGYEPFALDTLVKTYTEDQIKTERIDVPRIQYEVDDKKKYYFPDIFIPHDNKLIEVKSTWTYKCKTDNIQLKAEACKAQGYNYEIWCYNGKGARVEV